MNRNAITAQVAPRPAALTYDGTRVLVCCTDRAIRIHDVQSGKQIGPAMQHGSDVVSATFSIDLWAGSM